MHKYDKEKDLFLNINQLDALNFFNMFNSGFYMFRAQVLIVRRAKLYYTISGIITRLGGRPVHRLCSIQSVRRLPTGVMIPEIV